MCCFGYGNSQQDLFNSGAVDIFAFKRVHTAFLSCEKLYNFFFHYILSIAAAVPVEKKTTLLCANYIAPEIKIVNQTDTQDDGVSDDYADDEKDTSEIAVHQQLEAVSEF